MQLGRILILTSRRRRKVCAIESSFQDGNAAPGGCGWAGEVQATLTPKDLLRRDGGKSLPEGTDMSAQDGWIQLAVELKAAQAMPGQGWRGAGGSAGAGRPRAGTGRAAVCAAISIAWVLAQHKPACLRRISQPPLCPHLGFSAGFAPSHLLTTRPCRTVPACARRLFGVRLAHCTAAAHLAL